jgi:hypothetical protein
MSRTRIRQVLLSTAVALAAAFGAVGSAQAVVYKGAWDPAYLGIFADLGWKANATFDVPVACLGQADGNYTISGSCSGFTILTAELDFYNNTTDSNPSTSPILESFALNTGVVVNGIHITAGKLDGINTGFFDAEVPTGGSMSIAGNGAYAFSLILFGGNKAQLAYAKPITESPICATVPVDGAECGFSKNTGVGVFAPVPEPETYALMLAGLAAIGFVARRRRA